MRPSVRTYLVNDDGERVFGPGPAELLRRIRECGSLRAGSIINALEDAKEDCVERWSAIAKLVDILRSPDGHTTDELAELDEEASNIVDIAIRLTTALTDSASYK